MEKLYHSPDKIKFPAQGNSFQYLIKPTYINQSKLPDLQTGPGNIISPTTECPPEENYTSWFDSSMETDNDPDNILGIVCTY